MTQEVTELPDVVYHRLFQEDADGATVLDELCTKFYDRQSYVKGDPHETSFKEGQRSVIIYLLQRASTTE